MEIYSQLRRCLFTRHHLILLGIAGVILFVPENTAQAQAAQPDELVALRQEYGFLFNTLLLLLGAFLVMWMAAGFAMLEAGLVRSKNVSMQCLKNIALYSIAGLAYWLVGYNLMYTGVDGGLWGSVLAMSFTAPESVSGGDYAEGADWMFQMVFCATTASIISGAVAERVRLLSFLIFVALLTGLIYPIVGAWKWGAGWLAPAEPEGSFIFGLTGVVFHDFAGSTIVHSVGGWAALVALYFVGARSSRYQGTRSVPIPASSVPLATLGTLILWLGWFGFNGGSQLAFNSYADAASVSIIFVNTNLAAAGGVIAAMATTYFRFGKLDVTIILNGALAGLVAITAEPLAPASLLAILIGLSAGVIVVFAIQLMDKLQLDDVVGAVPVHLVCGIWGTLLVPLSNDSATFAAQLFGIVAIALFTVVVSAFVWAILRLALGARVDDEAEFVGLDRSEIGVEAYPEFTQRA